MDKRKLPTWIEAVGLIGLILSGVFMLAGLAYGVWLIVRKVKR